jgi:aerobic carbon-monoxide dehydrogenase medium subunit
MPAVPFKYHTPATLAEVLDLLAAHGEEAKPLAGGQSLVPMLTLRLIRPAVIVDLARLEELRGVRRENGTLHIGALVRHRALERGEGTLSACPVLQEAAGYIGNVRVRTLGTIGGSLAHADPAAELPAVVRALDATIVARGPNGERLIPASDFFVSILTTALRPGEVLVEVRVPVLGPRVGYALEEFSRRAGDFAIVASVAIVELDSEGRVAHARVALAGVGPTPCRLSSVEGALTGARASGETFRRVVAAASLEIDPSSDVHASAVYRKHLSRVLTARALERAAAVAAGRAGL